MAQDPIEIRQKLTFEQAEGVERLPEQLKPKEMSEKLRSYLWYVAYENMKTAIKNNMYGRGSYFEGGWERIFYDHHVFRLNRFADEFKNDAASIIRDCNHTFKSGTYVEIFGFLQYVIRHFACPPRFPERVDWALKNSCAAYRVLGGNTIVPIGSEQELKIIQGAFVDLQAEEFNGARKHLSLSASKLNEGSYPDSIRESVNAVESVARVLSSTGLLSDALSVLEKKTNLHPALKRGFSSIYGYTSDEKGIRHPLIDDAQARVDEIDALFMIGACASFVSYLINKTRLNI